MVGSTETKVFNLFGAILDDEGRERAFSLGTLCAFLEPLGVSAEASRLALSRMARKGYLATVRQGRASFYSLTAKGLAEIRAAEAGSVYREEAPPWDGRLRLVSYEIPEGMRESRTALACAFRAAGFGRAAAGLWAGARDLPEGLRTLVDAPPYHGRLTEYLAELRGDPRAFASRVFGLEAAGSRVLAFIDRYQGEKASFAGLLASGRKPAGADCFRRYFDITTDFVELMNGIPPLPAELLPEAWPAGRATGLFASYKDLVREGAGAYIEAVDTPYIPRDTSGNVAKGRPMRKP